MKKLNALMNCLVIKIKKNIFNGEKSEINHACEELKKMASEATSIEDFKLTDEYILKYNTTTRWQTI